MKRKFDVQTAKKLLSTYAEKVNFYMKENEILKRELDDLRTNLEINKDILYKQISSQLKEKDKKVLSSLKAENMKISQTNKDLYREKIDLEKKVYRIQQELDEALIRLQEMQDRESTETFIMDNQLKEKDSLILQLKKELDKYYREDFNSTKELIICEPDKEKVEMNNELVETRELIGKYNRLLQCEKRKCEELERKVQMLTRKVESLKKKKKIKEKMENIEMFGYILSSSDESEETHNEDVMINLESPIIKFPEKIKQPKYLVTDISEYNQQIPKLDLTKVLMKYQPLKHIDVVEGVKMTNRSSDEFIEKLKFQLKYARNVILKYKKKNKELKKIVMILKQHCISLKNNVNSCSTKSKTGHNVKEDDNGEDDGNNVNNKNNNNNDSMDPNTSIRDYEDEYEESDFNYIIKEYNRNVCGTSESKII